MKSRTLTMMTVRHPVQIRRITMASQGRLRPLESIACLRDIFPITHTHEEEASVQGLAKQLGETLAPANRLD
jgi:hypothetical protein